MVTNGYGYGNNNGSSGGGCSVLVALLLAMAVFLAGFMLSESSRLDAQVQPGGPVRATPAQQTAQIAELRAEVTRLQSEHTAAIAALVQAENARIAARDAAARAVAERDQALADASAAQAEAAAEREAAREQLAQTEAALAESQHKLAEAQRSLKVAYSIYQDQQANIELLQQQVSALEGKLAAEQTPIPTTGGPAKFRLGNSWLFVLGGGLACAALGINGVRRRSGRSEVYVKMTRAEAHEYARWRSRRA